MITSKNYNSHRLPRSIGHCPWSLRRVSRNALPILPLNPLKGTWLLCWCLGGASHLPGTDFSLDPSVVMETSLVMKNSLGLQPPSQTAFLWTDRELVKMKHQSRSSSAPSCPSSWQCGPPRPPWPWQACPAPGRGGRETSGAGGASGKPRRRRGPSAGVTEALPPVGRFLITVSISVLVIGLFIFCISSWFSLGRLCISKNLSISSRLSILLAYSCL